MSVVVAGGLLVADAAPSTALPRGESVSFPGGLTISNYVMPNGTRAYCIEIQLGEPSGYISEAGRVSTLPGRSGMFSAWSDPNGMRQMNYLIDRHGQNRDAWTAAAVQLGIWRLRANFLQGNPFLNAKIATLEGSAQGRALIVASDVLIDDARRNANAPGTPKPVSGKLAITPDPGGKEGRYRVAYPKGTTELSVTGGVFVRNGATVVSVAAAEASARYVDAAPGERQIRVTGAWTAQGSRGWDPVLDIYNTSTASGGVGQRLAVATGDSKARELRGRFDAVTQTLPPPFGDPTAVTQAQPSADVGGTMTDALIVAEAPGTRARIWPGAVADFTAYLEPVPGEPKYGADWEPLFEEPQPAPPPAVAHPGADERGNGGSHDDRTAGATSLGRAPVDGEPVDEDSGAAPGTQDPSSAADLAGATGPDASEAAESAGDRSAPERTERTENAEDAEDSEDTRTPLIWTAEEIAAMSPAERCVAQPVYREGGIAVTRLGEYRTRPVTVRSQGTVNWVERITSGGRTVHQGECGVPNERTVIEQPGAVTAAQPSVRLGETVRDTATVSGRFAPELRYSIRFEAFRAVESEDGVPLCTADNRIYRSEPIPVAGPGDVKAPGFVARWEHGTRLWWVETLSLETDAGSQRLHRGACGLDTETSAVGRPEVSTVAPETAVVGDRVSDTAVVTGELTTTEHARWELTFAGYRGSDAADEAAAQAPPVCTPENLLFDTGATAVTGPGEYRSEEVTVPRDWVGTLWWVETLWLVEGENRIPVSTGTCGAVTETTIVTTPEVDTRASQVVATGEQIRDVAEVSGELSQRAGVQHDLVFEGYRGQAVDTGSDRAECTPENALFRTEPIPVPGPGEIVSPELTALPDYGDTIWWVAVLRQHADGASSELARGACGAPEETTTIQPPRVRTESAGTVAVGDEMFDTAVVEGRLAEREGVSFLVRFTAFAAGPDGVLRCDADRVIPELSDETGVAVTGPGRYSSKRVTTTAAHVGVGGFVETLVMQEAGNEYVVHEGSCGAESEQFAVVAEASPTSPTPLAQTGGSGPRAALVLAGILLVAALAAAGIARRRRRVCRDDRAENS